MNSSPSKCLCVCLVHCVLSERQKINPEKYAIKDYCTRQRAINHVKLGLPHAWLCGIFM